jgi:transposase
MMENENGIAPELVQPVVTKPKRIMKRRSLEERRRLVEASLAPGATIAKVAGRHGVRANQLSAWRKLYREGRLGGAPKPAATLLPVEVVGETGPARKGERLEPGCMEVELARGKVRVCGAVDGEAMRVALELLR